MAQKQPHNDQTEKSALPDLVSSQFATMGKKVTDQFVEMQMEVLKKLQEANMSWYDRVLSEANLASEFATKLTAARSIPETATLFQEWTNRRMEMVAEDSKHFLADAQKFMKTGARFLSNDWSSGVRGGST